MPTPFDHLEKFQSLPEEAKTKIVDKFNTYSPEEKEKIMQKINTPMGNRGYEKPLQDISVTPLTTSDFNASSVAEGLTPHVGPQIAAKVGAAFEMIPPVIDTAVTVGGAAGLARAGLAATPAIAEGITSAASTVGKALAQTGAKEAGVIGEKIAELPIKQTAVLRSAEVIKKEAGAALNAAEKELGIGLKDTSSKGLRNATKNPDKIAAFTDRAGRLADKGADWLAEHATPEQLQRFRKASQMAVGKTADKATRARLYQINNTYGEAIALKHKGFSEGLSRIKEAEQVLKGLPAQFKNQKQVLNLALVKAKNEAAAQLRLLKRLGVGAGAATVLGIGSAVKNKLTK